MESRFSRIFERLLVFSTVVSLMLTAASVFSTVINNPEVERILIDWFTYAVIIGAGILFTFILQIFALEKIHPAMHIVFIFFFIIGILVLCYFTGKRNAPYVLIFILLIQYFLQAGINELFIFHDAFMADCEIYEGKELEKFLFHNNLSAIDLTEKIKGQQAIMFAVSVAMFIVLVFGKLSEGLFTWLTIILVMIFYLSLLLCCFMLGIFKNDIYYAFLGFKNYVQNGRKLFGAILLIAAISGTAGALLSSENAIIKIEYIQEYKEAHESDVKTPEIPDSSFDLDFVNDLHEKLGRDEKSSWIVELIGEIIKWLIIFVFTGLGLVFFIRPFFSKHFRIFWKEGHLLKFLHDLWQEVKEFFRYIFSKDSKVSDSYSTVQGKKFHDSMMDFLKKAKRSKEKVAEIDRLTKVFMKLIDWGEAHEIKYSVNLAPAEYTSLFKSENASHAGSLFEKALYDKNVLTAQEEKAFIDAINMVMR